MSEARDGRRFAISFTPPSESEPYRFGSAWLGRDALTGAELERPVNGFPAERWRRITAAPKLYGFHATLKPPVHLHIDVVPLFEQSGRQAPFHVAARFPLRNASHG